MFISKITICNLFAYYGQVEVEFKKCEGRNLYCIYGNNGFGKTSFIRCAKLLFLGVGVKEAEIPNVIKRFAPRILSAKKLLRGDSNSWAGILNKAAIKEGLEEFFVSFEGTLGDKNFTLTRTFKNVYGEIEEELTLNLDRETLKDEKAQERIDTILPPNLTEFFFFDGEELGELSNNLREEFQGKIEEILQIKPLDTLIKQIQNHREDLIKNEQENKEQRNTLENAMQDRKKCERNLNYNKERLKSIEYFIEQKANQITQIQKKIEKLSADSSKEQAELISEKNELDKELVSSKEQLKESIKSVIFVSNEVLLQDLKAEIQKLQSSKSASDIEVFKRLLPEFKAFMNAELENSEIFKVLDIKSIEDIMDKFPNKLEHKGFSNSFIMHNMLPCLGESLVRLENVSLAQDIKDIKSTKNKLMQVKNDIDALSSDDSTREKQKALKEEMGALESEKSQEEQKKEDIKISLRHLEIQKEQLDREIDSLKQKINTERIDNKLKILESLQKSIEQYRKKLNNKLREELHSLILQNYQKLLPNDNIKELSISEDFEIKLKDENDEQIIIENQSSGQKQILAIAIFWALSKLSNSNLPLIIDTPLSRIDRENRARIIQNYYASNAQVIILPHSGEMGEREYEYAKPYLAELYRIDNKADRKHATIKNARKEEIL
ncbi:AAA family ATPase [Helicobacter himalayensis]|uniref:AAA family ATPase n=1 Tax=Helicobacter himalayensis TaxID=1591088 RepID=UPI003D6FCCDE